MKTLKTYLLLLLIVTLALTPIDFAVNEDSDLIVYALLGESGVLEETYTVAITENQGDYDYTQSYVENYELPWKFSFEYALDGQTIPPSALGGQSGNLSLSVKIDANTVVDPSNFTLQMVISMPSEKVKNIVAPGAVVAYNGNNRQMIYTLLPDETHAFTLTCDVTELEMSPIYITATPMSLDLNLPDATEAKIQYNTLKDGADALAQGSTSLFKSSSPLVEAFSQLNQGATRMQSELRTALSQNKAIDELLQSNTTFLTQLRLQARQLEQVMASADAASLETLTAQYQQVLQTIGLIEANQQVIIAQTEGLQSVASGLNTLVDGVKTLSNGMFALHEGIKTLSEGAAELNAGILQGDAEYEKLFDQLDRMKGLSPSTTELLSNEPSQYVLRTPAILKITDEAVPAEDASEPLNFWGRILKLFGLK